MRLFIAFEVSKEAGQHLSLLQKQLVTDNAKITLAKVFHLTLKFLGEVSPAKAEEVRKRLESIKFEPFTASLDGTGVFPSESSVRVVWVGLEPKDIICNLQKQIDEALHGLFPKEKEFQPHITLARVKTVKDKKQFAEHIKSLKVKPISFEVKHIKLIESQLTGEGHVYRDIAVFPPQPL
ncbi:MAG TPA: RNA 2',3'-cyclic phosphodiesterase [Candidatus Nanoarchaeia archaeon]|nr:RNA 2',3'-cyclic phosphodiesterase [Candidatus Nanoarchaeia archaeon]